MSSPKDKADRPRRHVCNECPARFPTKSKLQYHERRHNGEKPYACELCPQTFASSGDLVRHIRSHTGEKPYSCTTCGKSFAASGGLTVHKRSHTNEKHYVCTLCLKCYKTGSGLSVHRRSHEEGNRFSCTFCDRAYTARHTLDRHLRTHTGEKPFRCTDDSGCGRRFYTTQELQRHRGTHHATTSSKASSHECEICQRQVSSVVALRNHKITQHDAGLESSSFACAECGSTFKMAAYLHQHQRTHSQTARIQCSLCEATYKTQQGLDLHIRSQHTREKTHVCSDPVLRTGIGSNC